MKKKQTNVVDISQINDLLIQYQETFTELSKGELDYDKECLYFLQALSSNSYLASLAVENKNSAINAFCNLASVGLSLDPTRKLAYLTPRRGQVVYDPSYQGLIDLATKSGGIDWVQAETVYQSDQFEFNGVGNKPIHVVKEPFSDNRGNQIGYYCVAKTSRGDYLCEKMSVKEINHIKSLSHGSNDPNSPWVTFFSQMAKKCVIKRAFNTWPKGMSSRIDAAIDVLNQTDGLAQMSSSISSTLPKNVEKIIPNFDPKDIKKISSEVKSRVQKLLDRCLATGSWGAGEDYLKGRFIGSDLAYAMYMLNQSKPK